MISAPTPPAAEPTPPAPPPARGWPAWFVSFDVALAVLAVALAFLMASFIARTSDLWRHLASGRLVTQGQYPFGADPFSYTATSGVWVNPNWLSEVLLYGLYSADTTGAVAVAVKAILFAGTVGLLLLLKKPGHSLWPWAVAAALGAVAAGAHTHLRPAVMAYPLFVGLLLLLYRADWSKGHKWRMPAAVGGLAAIWVNVDSFGFVVPFTVGLVALGEWLHPKVFSARTETPAESDPFHPPPPLAGLLRALLLAVVGLLLNPTFLAAVPKDAGEAFAQLLPFELDAEGAATLAPDVNDLGRGTRAALNDKYVSDELYGNNPAGILALVLIGLTVVAAGVNFRQGRLGYLLSWLGVVLLAAVVHARFLPYAVLAGVPLLAAHLNGLGRFVPSPDKVPDRISGVLFSLARLGRAVSLLALVLLLAAAVPGWLHPKQTGGNRGLMRYVMWKVEPDEGMVRAGQVFNGWRSDPTTAELMGTRGLHLHPDLGDYLAWHAPAEKSFVTSRYRLHRGQLADLMATRLIVRPPETDDRTKPNDPLGKLIPLADKYQAGYVALGQGYRVVSVKTARDIARGLDPTPQPPTGELPERPVAATLWHADGRLLVVGRSEAADALRWDAVRLVFGTKSDPPQLLTADQQNGITPQEGWVNDLMLLRPPVSPPALNDARFYLDYYEYVGRAQMKRTEDQYQTRAKLWRDGMHLVGGVPAVIMTSLADEQGRPLNLQPPRATEAPDSALAALPLLAERSLRAAAARAPDEYQNYEELAKVAQLLPDTDPPRNLFASSPPSAPTDRQLQIVTALNRTLARLPASKSPQEQYARPAIQVRVDLAAMNMQLGYVGSARRVCGELVEVLAGPLPANIAAASAESVAGLWNMAMDKALAELPPDVQTRLQGQPRNQKEADDLFNARVAALVKEKLIVDDDHPAKWLEAYRTEAKANADATTAAVKAKQAVPLGMTAAVELRAKRAAAVLEQVAGRRYTRSGAANLTPEQQFYALVAVGLPDAAYDLFPKPGETGKTAPKVLPHDSLRVVLWLGYAEVVAKELPELKQSLAAATGLSPESVVTATAKYRLVEHDLARLLGDYTTAERLRDELLAAPPPGQPDLRNSSDTIIFPDLWQGAAFPPLTPAEVEAHRQIADVKMPAADHPAVFFIAGPGWRGMAEMQQVLASRLLFESYTHYQRGVYALLAGDPAKAEVAFEKAAKPGGVALDSIPLPPALRPTLGSLLPEAKRKEYSYPPPYLELLKKYPNKR